MASKPQIIKSFYNLVLYSLSHGSLYKYILYKQIQNDCEFLKSFLRPTLKIEESTNTTKITIG